jgi:hypothetical protein
MTPQDGGTQRWVYIVGVIITGVFGVLAAWISGVFSDGGSSNGPPTSPPPKPVEFTVRLDRDPNCVADFAVYIKDRFIITLSPDDKPVSTSVDRFPEGSYPYRLKGTYYRCYSPVTAQYYGADSPYIADKEGQISVDEEAVLKVYYGNPEHIELRRTS